MSTPPPHDPSSGQPPQPPGQPPYPQQPPGHPPQGPPPGAPQYAPPPSAPAHAGPPQPPYGPGQPPYGPGQPPYGPGQPPYGPGPGQPYGQPPYGPPPQKQGMSTGAKVGIGVGSAVLVLALVVGVIVVLPLGDDESGSAAPETSETDEDTTEENGNDDTVPDPDAEVFTGSEDERIELDESHSDPRIVAIEAEDFASVTLLGPDDGVYASLGSDDGETNRVMYNYFEFEESEIAAIEVSGMGDWTVTLEPLSAAIPWTDPNEPLEGEGSEVYSIDWDTSGEDVAMEHNGDSNFAIWAINLDEGDFELLVNEIGTYEGTETLPAGSAFLDVAADGRWSMSVS